METWFLLCAESNALGAVAWKRGSFYTQRQMLSVEKRGNVPFYPRRARFSVRGGQDDRLNGVESWFLFSADGNALGGWHGNVFLISAEGNLFGGVAWKRVSLYPRRVIRSVEWRGNVFPCIRGGQCAPWICVETWFLVSAKGNALGIVVWKVFLVSAEGKALGVLAWKFGSL